MVLADHILDMGSKTNILLSGVMEETGGLGADIIIDTGGTVVHVIVLGQVIR